MVTRRVSASKWLLEHQVILGACIPKSDRVSRVIMALTSRIGAEYAAARDHCIPYTSWFGSGDFNGMVSGNASWQIDRPDNETKALVERSAMISQYDPDTSTTQPWH